MVAAILEAGKIWWASVGDSHLYLIRDKTRKKVNADHSYGGFLDRMEAAGTPVEPEPGLARNMLMSAMTGDELNEIDVSKKPLELQDGDRILICSDGMDTLSEGKFVQFSDWSENPKECTEALLTAVEDEAKPKQDNTTIVIVDVKSAEQAAAPAPEPTPEPVADTAPVEAEPAPVAQPAAETWQPVVEEPEKKSNTGMIIGIAAAVLIAVGVGGFVMFGGGAGTSAPRPVTSAVVDTTELETATEELADTSIEEETVATSEPVQEAEAIDTAPAAAAATTSTATVASGEFTDNLADGSAGPSMVVLAAGSFDMGSAGSSSNSQERPRHNVNIRQFAISKYEVSFEEYEKYTTATGRAVPDNLYMDKATHPVIFVTWDDAFYYARWLSEQTGERYNLPTESQWELRCRNWCQIQFLVGI